MIHLGIFYPLMVNLWFGIYIVFMPKKMALMLVTLSGTVRIAYYPHVGL